METLLQIRSFLFLKPPDWFDIEDKNATEDIDEELLLENLISNKIFLSLTHCIYKSITIYEANSSTCISKKFNYLFKLLNFP